MAGETMFGAVLEARGVAARDPRVVVLAEPRSAAAEQFRILSRKLEPRIAAGQRRLAVTSTIAGEGRSTCAVNVALSLAMGGRQRVALVDAHLRAPAVERMLSLPPGHGLVDVVLERCALEAAIVPSGAGGLWVLRAGETRDPHEILAARGLQLLLAELAERFEAVVVDAPPILPTADLLGFAAALDGLLMVVQAGGPRRELVELALQTVRAPALWGWVLNRAEEGVAAPLQSRHDRGLEHPAGSAFVVGAGGHEG